MPQTTTVIHDDFSSDSPINAGLDSNREPFDQIRRKLDLVNRLHNTGAQLDVDLPQIVVVGNQSAGKSSLIEAISGISLPRQSGTCTRCPIECKLVCTDAAWQCTISLRMTTDARGQQLGQPRILQFGNVLTDKSEVEERIRGAQQAILNPSKPMELFLKEQENDVEEEEPELNFSSNCITLCISGPGIPDLSFCDLPGLLASVSSRHGINDKSISLVENLVSSYIKKPSCLILLTVACETDFENQGAHRLVKAHDPEGSRTIGVLTKPDRIPAGEESAWIPFIRDEKEQLENSWFCVKQPSSRDLKSGITHDKAREMENDFFSAKLPWCELGDTYRKYLGTSNLVKQLTNLLSKLIVARLPQIQGELTQSISLTREALKRLPPPPSSDARTEILTLLHTFTHDVALYMQGVPDSINSTTDVGLIQSILSEQQKFKWAVRLTAPNFSPFEVTTDLQPPTFLAEEEEQGTMENVDHKSGQVIFIDEVLRSMQMARTRELPGHYPFVVLKMFIERFAQQWEAPSETLCKNIHSIVSAHVKKVVHRHLNQFGQGKLEQRVSTIVQQHIDECYSRARERVQWLRRLEGSPFTMNTHYLADYKEKFLAYYKGARAEQLTRRQHVELELTSQMPRSQPTTQPPHGSTVFKGSSDTSQRAISSTAVFPFALVPASPARTAALSFPLSNAPTFPPTATSALFQPSAHEMRTAALNKVLSGLAEMGISGISEADLPKLLPSDRMEPALTIMADVRAYFQVAYKRFVDNVPLAIDTEMVLGVPDGLPKVLFSQLGINGPNGDAICKDLLQESRRIVERRTELSKKLERLEAGLLELLTEFS